MTMANTQYLFAAFGITWVILFAYIFSIMRRQKSLENDLEKIQEILKNYPDI